MSTRTLSWLILAVLLCGLGLRLHAHLQTQETETITRQNAVYQYVRHLIQDNYVKEVDDKKLFYGAMGGMASTLDRHSQFLPPEDYEQLRTTTTGQFEGVGIELNPDESLGLVVLTPIEGTPAYKGGVFPGDKIVKIDGVPTENMSREEADRRIKGAIGTSVRLALLHQGESQPVEVTLTRAVNEVKALPVAEMLAPPLVAADGPKIGYVQIPHFQPKTATDLNTALNKLEQQGLQALIIDLRQNPGGLLDAAEQVADLFLKDGAIVTVITRAAAKEKTKGSVAYAEDKGTHPDYPLAILVDSHSASASEVVAGSLKDRGRAVLVGEKTYGKFSVQNVFQVPLGNWGESALKLTTARYQTPSSPCIDGQGLVPDFPIAFTPEQQRGLQLSRLQRHIKDNDPRNGNGKAPKTTPDSFDDLQLKKAIEVLLGRVKAK